MLRRSTYQAVYFVTLIIFSLVMLFSALLSLAYHGTIRELLNTYQYPEYLIYPIAAMQLMGLSGYMAEALKATKGMELRRLLLPLAPSKHSVPYFWTRISYFTFCPFAIINKLSRREQTELLALWMYFKILSPQ